MSQLLVEVLLMHYLIERGGGGGGGGGKGNTHTMTLPPLPQRKCSPPFSLPTNAATNIRYNLMYLNGVVDKNVFYSY